MRGSGLGASTGLAGSGSGSTTGGSTASGCGGAGGARVTRRVVSVCTCGAGGVSACQWLSSNASTRACRPTATPAATKLRQPLPVSGTNTQDDGRDMASVLTAVPR